MSRFTAVGVKLCLLGVCLLGLTVAFNMQTIYAQFAAADPGVRGGAPGAGGPLPGLSAGEQAFFNAGLAAFAEVDSVQGTIAGEDGKGLGPVFNMNSCAGCHAQPAVGGTSPAVNPQVAVATLDGATNTVPFFITLNGPVREARFKFNPDGSRDGGVHDLYTITGRTDAPGCNIAQPDFNSAAAHNNLIFRVPTPAFGAGLIEAVPESTILANKNANGFTKALLGISGHENRNGNDGTITRFGWKAQNKSLLIFSGEAYNVEQGVTNEVFQNERNETPGCLFNGIPEDHTNFDSVTATATLGDVVHFSNFMRLSAPPAPVPDTTSIANGRNLFRNVGCTLCHTQSLTTGKSSVAALSNKTLNLYSDLLVHNMGSGLADNIVQGGAGPDEFRTAPLWGLGQRIFFLHDGRTSDLQQAIQAHSSNNSEANAVISIFNSLSQSQKQDVLNFLRGL